MLSTLTLAVKLASLKFVAIITSFILAGMPLNNSSKLILTGVGRLATHENSAVWGGIDGTNMTLFMDGETEDIGRISAAKQNTIKWRLACHQYCIRTK